MHSQQWYAAELQEIERERESLRVVDRRMNMARGALFFGALILLALGWAADARAPLGAELLWWAGWILLAAFLVVVAVHESRRERLEMLRNRRNVLRRLVARLERHWDRLPAWTPPPEFARESLESGGVADDLDLFGQGSLMQLVSMAYTGPGLRTLGTWMTGAALASTGQARATAARSLVADRETRLRFYSLARRCSQSAAEPDAFTDWATGPRWLDGRGWLRVWAWIAPLSCVLLFVVGTFIGTQWREAGEGLDFGLGLLLAAIPIAANVVLSVWMSGPIHAIFAKAVNRRGDIEGYIEMFATGETLPEHPEMVADIRRRLVGRSEGAADGMRALARVARLVVMRRGGIGYLVFMLLQLVTLWDVHLLARLERWQVAHGRFAPEWFAALGELEALQSLAALHDDYPQWAVPEWIDADGQCGFEAQELAHPLLRDGARVANSVSIGPPGTLLLVTGSNMSGKSTLLRSVGLNVVLAGAGGPVCASAMRLPSLELATSIRVRDNLREGVSFYMAELHRLRDVVAHARRVQPRGDRKVLYLLDEILQGTNSRERAIAVVRVLQHLMHSGAIGAISTHDLELAEDPDLASRSHVVHFRETIETDAAGRETMRFDYRMREGVTPTTNALRLLDLVGLGVARAEASAPSAAVAVDRKDGGS